MTDSTLSIIWYVKNENFFKIKNLFIHVHSFNLNHDVYFSKPIILTDLKSHASHLHSVTSLWNHQDVAL